MTMDHQQSDKPRHSSLRCLVWWWKVEDGFGGKRGKSVLYATGGWGVRSPPYRLWLSGQLGRRTPRDSSKFSRDGAAMLDWVVST